MGKLFWVGVGLIVIGGCFGLFGLWMWALFGMSENVSTAYLVTSLTISGSGFVVALVEGV